MLLEIPDELSDEAGGIEEILPGLRPIPAEVQDEDGQPLLGGQQSLPA